MKHEQTNERTLQIKGKGMARGQSVQIKELPMNKIKLSRNSRLSISDDDLSGLMQSINTLGLLEPIGVVEGKSGGYEICYGNRRYLAFSKLGLHSIPAVIHKRGKDNDVDVKNLAENVQRRNISLAEVGRYATILEGEGLNLKELAVRLGTPVNYIDSCIRAYRDVPEKFRNDLAINVPGKKAEPGKISIQAARSIVNATKSYSLTRPQAEVLYKAAKKQGYDPVNTPKYAAAVKAGKTDPIKSVVGFKTVNLNMMLPQDQYDKLMEKYVENGPFNSFRALVRAVCRGQKQVMINFIE